MIKLILVWLFAAAFAANSISISLHSNLNAGVLLMWCVTFAFVFYGLFYKKIDAFCAKGFGFWLKCAFFTGVLFFAGLVFFIFASGQSQKANGKERAIIVLGAGIKGQTVGDVLKRRLQATILAFEENPNAVIVVTGGQGYQEDIPEALAMQRFLVANGVPEASIIMEDKSTSTEENLTNAKALLAKAGIEENQPIAVATSAFHCYRARTYAKKLGFSHVTSVPASVSQTVIAPVYMRETLAVLYMWVFKVTL